MKEHETLLSRTKKCVNQTPETSRKKLLDENRCKIIPSEKMACALTRERLSSNPANGFRVTKARRNDCSV
jgi:hypothetical protein